jgi:hypothetical protein
MNQLIHKPENQPTKGLFAQKIKAEGEIIYEISNIRPAP